FNIIKMDTLQGGICMTNASDIMTKNIVAARASTTAREIGTKLLIGNFNGLPVVDNNIKLIGIVTAIDIFQAIRQGKNLDSLRAIDIMTQNPVTVKHDTDINEVIDIILQRHIILVPVIDDKRKLIGLVGRPDILKQNLNQKFVTITEKRKCLNLTTI
ncbi:MAG: CBS domain-containing protein, partial [Candidatus Nitrosopolaris sp.]